MKKDNDSFCISLDTQFVIYGCGGDGQIVSENLKSLGFRVVGFVDQRAEEIKEYLSLPVCRMSDITQYYDNTAVVVITLKNVFLHSEIAQQLAQRGYECIICSPVSVSYKPSSYTQCVSSIYNGLLSDGSLKNQQIVPRYKSELFHARDELIISHHHQRIRAWIPIEYVCNYRDDSAFHGFPIASIFPLVDIYRLFLGSSVSHYDDSLLWYVRYAAESLVSRGIQHSEVLEQSLIESRAQVFASMSSCLQPSMQFFIDNAPAAACGDDGHLTLESSGRNRLAYLVAEGFRFLPLSISQRDYTHWRSQRLVNVRPTPSTSCSMSRGVPSSYMSSFIFPAIRLLLKQLASKSLFRSHGFELLDSKKFREVRSEYRVGTVVCDDGRLAYCLRHMGFLETVRSRALLQWPMTSNTESDDLEESVIHPTDRDVLGADLDCLVLDSRAITKTMLCNQRLYTNMVLLFDWNVTLAPSLVERGFRKTETLLSAWWDGCKVDAAMYRKM